MNLDITKTIEPKSDQMNADDLIGGQSKTIKITKVTLLGGDQPVALNYEGDNGKPYKPGKSMRRVIVNAWGGDGNLYAGRSLTLYCDPEVRFGGMAVGGIRISHMSHINKEIVMALTASRANKKPFVVKPLVEGAIDLEAIKANLTANANNGMTSLEAEFKKLSNAERKAALPLMEDLKKIAADVDNMPKAEQDKPLF